MLAAARRSRSCSWASISRLAGSSQDASSALFSTSSAHQDVKSAFRYCKEQVHRYDHDAYLWCLLLPKDVQASTLALRAFNVETALVADASKELPIQQMRMMWWREAIKSIYTGDTDASHNHPVVQALSFVASQRPLSRYWLQRIVSAREGDLDASGPPTMLADLEAYSESTNSALMYLQLEAAGVKDKSADHAASHLGKALGLSTILRGTAHHAQARRCYIPVELLAKHKVSQESIYKGESSEALKDAVLEVAGAAKGHLDHARALGKDLQAGPSKQLMLGAVGCRLFLDALEAVDFDVFHPAMQKRGGVSPVRLQMEIQWASMRGTY